MHNFIWFFFRVFEEVGSVSTIPDSLRLKIPAPSFGGMFFRMILALTIIIILIYLVAYVFKKLSKQGENKSLQFSDILEKIKGKKSEKK